MQPLIITIMGKDKPGLIDSLAKCVYRHDANWLSSNFAHMAGLFTGFVEVHVPADKHDELVKDLDSITDLTVQAVTVADKGEIFSDTFTIEIMGNDKPGLVQELTSVLNQFNMNIVSFDSRCESAPNWGSLMFKARAVIAVPENFDLDALRERLEDTANDLVVDINTRL